MSIASWDKVIPPEYEQELVESFLLRNKPLAARGPLLPAPHKEPNLSAYKLLAEEMAKLNEQALLFGYSCPAERERVEGKHQQMLQQMQFIQAMSAKLAEITQKSKAAAVEKYGAVMVAAAERFAFKRLPDAGFYPHKPDHYEKLVEHYRASYRSAMTAKVARFTAAGAKRFRGTVAVAIRGGGGGGGGSSITAAEAIDRMHRRSGPFIGPYYLMENA